ncbi:helix-turn-helix transcriptional regulator [Gordonia alkanivorans]|uniref:helix-turn-helix domain-containing protein n=1 Tax=Gordonia alkanivorans TaxID=84096 RepID=UPI0024468AE4|nr:helix-turn-helix transcriptional regulator [Gordonia alkanivorans]MDH3049743.1 helix-turn-helix transcriptional regulator [Gordonia alkanivorans]
MENIHVPVDDWVATRLRATGDAISERRRVLGITAAVLSERTKALGYPISRGTIAKIESGHRKGLDVFELIVIASALRIPPVQLLYPRVCDGGTRYVPAAPLEYEARAIRRFSGRLNSIQILDSVEGDVDGADDIRREARHGAEALGKLELVVRWDEIVDDIQTFTQEMLGHPEGSGGEAKYAALLRDAEREYERVSLELEALGVPLPPRKERDVSEAERTAIQQLHGAKQSVNLYMNEPQDNA